MSRGEPAPPGSDSLCWREGQHHSGCRAGQPPHASPGPAPHAPAGKGISLCFCFPPPLLPAARSDPTPEEKPCSPLPLLASGLGQAQTECALLRGLPQSFWGLSCYRTSCVGARISLWLLYSRCPCRPQWERGVGSPPHPQQFRCPRHQLLLQTRVPVSRAQSEQASPGGVSVDQE